MHKSRTQCKGRAHFKYDIIPLKQIKATIATYLTIHDIKRVEKKPSLLISEHNFKATSNAILKKNT